MKSTSHAILIALVTLASCAIEYGSDSAALSDDEIEADKNAMCKAKGCETSSDESFGGHRNKACEEFWTEYDDMDCDAAAGVTRHTFTYMQWVPLYPEPDESGYCKYARIIWEGSFEVPLADGGTCEEPDDGDGGTSEEPDDGDGGTSEEPDDGE